MYTQIYIKKPKESVILLQFNIAAIAPQLVHSNQHYTVM